MIAAVFTVLLLLFPGLLMLPYKKFLPHAHAIEKIPVAVGISLAYWITSFWMLSILPITQTALISVSLSTAIVIFIYSMTRHKFASKSNSFPLRTTLLLLVWFVLLSIPVILLAKNLAAPSGADMSMHAYLAKIIFLTDRFPTTMEPLLPVSHFGYYPIGFPILISALMHINHLPVYTNAVILTAFTYWFFAGSVFTLMRTKFSIPVSIIVTISIAWVSRTPIDIIAWGGNPMVLAFCFFVLGYASLTQAKKHTPFILLAGLFFYATLLTHYIIAVAGLYLSFILLPFFFPQVRTMIQRSFRWQYIIFLSALVIPFLWHMRSAPFLLSERTMQLIMAFHREEIPYWNGGWNTLVPGLYEFFRDTYGFPIVILYLCMVGVNVITRKKEGWMHITLIAALLLLLINSRLWVLPFSSLLYPKRVALIFLLPLSLGIASGLQISSDLLRRWLIKKWHLPRSVTIAIFILFIGIFSPVLQQNILWLVSSYRYSAVTKEDIEALLWIKMHTTTTDIIVNNYFDAGLWIPAISERKITTYHTNPIDMKYLTLPTQATYAFVGNKTVADDPNNEVIKLSETEAESYRYLTVYKNDKATVYKIRQD